MQYSVRSTDTGYDPHDPIAQTLTRPEMPSFPRGKVTLVCGFFDMDARDTRGGIDPASIRCISDANARLCASDRPLPSEKYSIGCARTWETNHWVTACSHCVSLLACAAFLSAFSSLDNNSCCAKRL